MGTFPGKVLLATDGSEGAAVAARAATAISQKAGAELHLVHAWTYTPALAYPGLGFGHHLLAYEEKAGVLLEEQVEEIRAAGGRVAGAHLREGRPADEIAGLAEEIGADLVVMGSRGTGTMKRLITGSASEGVVHLAPCPVLVVRGGEGAWPPRRLVIGDDSSSEAAAAKLAAKLGKLLGARALLVRAYPPHMFLTRAAVFHPPRAGELLERSEVALKKWAQELELVLGRRPEVSVVAGEPASIIQEVAEEDGEPTLVVVGSRGFGAVKRFALGSVSTDVLRAVDRPVLVVPPPRRGSA